MNGGRRRAPIDRGRRRAPVLLLAGVAVALSAAPPPLFANPADDLKRAEQELQRREAERRQLEERAAKLEEERLWLSAQLVALADEARALDGELGEIENSLETLAGEEAEKTAAMAAEQGRLAELLAALQRLARIPPEAAIARPQAPLDALRSALVLRDLAPAVRREAARLAHALEQLAEVRRQLEDQRSRAAAARQDLAARAQQINMLAGRREALARQTDAERAAAAQRAARLSSQAADLRQLMERVEQERRAAAAAAQKRETERLENERRVAEAQAAAKAAEDARRAAEKIATEKLAAEKLAAEKLAAQKQETEKQEALRKEAERKESERKTAEAERQARRSAESPAAALGSSGLRRPASGRVAARFGQTDRSGAESRGLSIAGRAGAPVVSPASGSIMYAGPFRNFGLILIVEHGNGYHSLLAGLGRIDVSVGRHVVAGEPLGALPGPGEADGDVRELYFELRSNGRPVDPERGFADKQGKGHG